MATAYASNPYGYRGYYTDSETGFAYLNARYYDPQTQRFTQEDTYWGDNLQRNLYAYCSGNPVMYTDPSGERAQQPIFPIPAPSPSPQSTNITISPTLSCPSGVKTAIKYTKWKDSKYTSHYWGVREDGPYEVHTFSYLRRCGKFYEIYEFWTMTKSIIGWREYLTKTDKYLAEMKQFMNDASAAFSGINHPWAPWISIAAFAFNYYKTRECRYIERTINKYDQDSSSITIVFYMRKTIRSADGKDFIRHTKQRAY